MFEKMGLDNCNYLSIGNIQFELIITTYPPIYIILWNLLKKYNIIYVCI